VSLFGQTEAPNGAANAEFSLPPNYIYSGMDISYIKVWHESSIGFPTAK
jgi:hypothetical protein